MRTLVLILGFVCLSLILAAGVRADEKQDAARMERLIVDLNKVVPNGWNVDFKFVDPEAPMKRGEIPAIAIESSTPFEVQYHYANPAPGEEPPISNDRVAVYVVVVPSMTVQEYADAHAKNEAIDRKRIDFVQRNDMRRKMRWGHMGGEPIPPDSFHPQSDAETRLVRQYAMLWAATQPRRLPTHHVDLLTFEFFDAGPIKILDAAKAQEYQKILDAIKKLFVPFESSP